MSRQAHVLARYLTPKVRDAVLAHPAVRGYDVRFAADDDAGGLSAQPLAVFATARALADDTCERLEALHPGVFTDLLGGRDLGGAFRLALTLRLAVDEIPRLAGFLADPRRRSGRTVLVNFSLHAEQIRRVGELAGATGPESDVVCLSTVTDALLDVLGRDAEHPRPGAGGPPPAGRALLLCGAERELGYLAPLAELLRDGGVVVLAKNDRPENLRACRALAAACGGAVVGAEPFLALSPTGPARRALARAVRSLRARHAVLGGEQRDFRMACLATLRSLLRTALAVESLVEAAGPALVAGALDRTAYGALLGLYADRGYATVDFQHGTVLPFSVMDLLAFDLALVWNRRSHAALVRDGYPPSAPVEVVGNPAWDTLRSPASTDATRALAQWKRGAKLVVAFPQPAKGPLLDRATLRRADEWLRDAVGARDDLRLLVKLRAGDDRGGEAFAALVAADRARVAADHQVSLAEALACADLAVSVYSTALVDALAAGVPAVSIDPAGLVGALGLDFGDALRVCRTAGELRAALTGGPLLQPVGEDVLPRFADPYPERLRAALERAGLLPGQATRR